MLNPKEKEALKKELGFRRHSGNLQFNKHGHIVVEHSYGLCNLEDWASFVITGVEKVLVGKKVVVLECLGHWKQEHYQFEYRIVLDVLENVNVETPTRPGKGQSEESMFWKSKLTDQQKSILPALYEGINKGLEPSGMEIVFPKRWLTRDRCIYVTMEGMAETKEDFPHVFYIRQSRSFSYFGQIEIIHDDGDKRNKRPFHFLFHYDPSIGKYFPCGKRYTYRFKSQDPLDRKAMKDTVKMLRERMELRKATPER